jgi:hypothetical protein
MERFGPEEADRLLSIPIAFYLVAVLIEPAASITMRKDIRISFLKIQSIHILLFWKK